MNPLSPLRTRVKAVIAQTFLIPATDVTDNAQVGMTEGWDSLGHLELMLALEQEFDVSISSEMMLELQDLPSIEEYLTTRGAHGGS